MEVDSPTKQEEPRRAFEKSLEEVSGDKLIDLKKTFAKKKWEKLKKKHNENPAPSLNRREIDKQPCGLYNSGNFCYVNSFLQTWFNDQVFRQCIYDWRPSPDFKNETSKMNIQDVMNAMQRLFVTMQLTPYEHTDAAELIDLLKLTNDQQDVQEFFILFIDAITRELEHHPNGAKIREQLLSRVEGTTKKTIKCTCGKANVTTEKFRHIQLHIENGLNSLTQLFTHKWLAEEPMSDYTCDVCGERGNTMIILECDHLPPVMVIQINRYHYDQATNRNKKIATAIQYPRKLSENIIRPDADPNSVYELGAVMIHEGPNATCGHYYDIIKDAKTNNWFTFNDKEVAQTKTPGVHQTKEKPGKATADMKGCYVLIYRKVETPLIDVETNVDQTKEIRLPPTEIVEEIQRKLDSSFQDKSLGEDLSYKVWTNCLNERFERLEHYWTLMEVDGYKAIIERPNAIAFAPTELFVDIQEKEYSAVNNLKDSESWSNGTNVNGSSFNEHELIADALEELGEHDTEQETDEEYMQRLMEATDAIREKKQKAVAKIKAEASASSNGALNPDILKLLYVSEPLDDITMTLCPHEKISFEMLKKGQVKAVNRNPVETLLQDYSIGIRLKRFETGQSEEASREESINVSGLLTGSDVCEDCFNLMRRDSTLKEELEKCNKIAKAVIKRSTIKGSSGYEYPPPDSYWASRAQVNSFKKLAISEMNYRKSLGRQLPSELIFSTKFEGFKKDSHSPIHLNGNSVHNDLVEDPPEKRRRLVSSQEHTPIDEEVHFNNDLICSHGNLDLDNKAKRVWLHKHEWETLVLDNFQTCREFPTTTQDCDECSDAHNTNEAKKVDCQAKLSQINQALGSILKRIEKRATSNEPWDHCNHMLCSKFIHKFRHAQRIRQPTMPTICQECLLCTDHNLPFKHFVGTIETAERLAQYDEASSNVAGTSTLASNGTNPQATAYGSTYVTGPLPITSDEWKSILAEFRSVCGDEFVEPVEVRIENGNYNEFCTDCESKFNETLLKRQCYYPEGADIFVKLKEDENDDIAGNAQTKVPTTRRVAQKNLIKVKLTSTNTIRELKTRLYQRIKQSPNDQLIYSGDRLLDDKLTLAEAFVTGNNSEAPLLLITQSHTAISDEPRVIEQGFCNTALAS